MLFSPVRRSMTDSAVRLRAGATCVALVAATACAGIAAAAPASAAATAPVAASAITQSVAAAATSPGATTEEPAAPESSALEAAPVVATEPSTPTATEVAGDPKSAGQPDDRAVDAPAASDLSAPPIVAPQPQPSVRTTPRAAAATTLVAAAPVITTQPEETWVDLGQSATFTAHASGSPTPTVQWQSRRWFEDPWTDIAGATSDSYQSPPASLNDDEPAFRAVFTNSAGTVATNAAELRQNDPPPAAGTPSVPRNVKARQTAPGQITITWKASASAGTSPITSYGAGYGTRRWGNGDDFSPTTFKAVFDDIDDGDYTAVVFAVNDVGISRRVVVPISVGDLPSAPRHASAVRSGSKVTVTWDTPLSAGYSPVEGYDVVLTSAAGRVTQSVPAGATSAVFTDLPAGTYRIVVTASNKVGAGSAASLSVTVPAATPPTPPTTPASALPDAAALAAPAAQLARTGLSGSAQTGLALGLLALGLALSFAARRLRSVGFAG